MIECEFPPIYTQYDCVFFFTIQMAETLHLTLTALLFLIKYWNTADDTNITGKCFPGECFIDYRSYDQP